MISQKFCMLIGKISSDVWNKLNLAYQYRTTIEEVSITDFIWSSLMECRDIETVATKRPGEVAESKTGADLEWWIIDRKLNKGVGLRIQAKIINKSRNGYDKLKYKIGDRYQIDVLIESAMNEKMIPLYSFYSYSHINSKAWEFAFAHQIQQLFIKSIENVHKRETLKDFLFTAEELFCDVKSIQDLVELFGELTDVNHPEQYIRESVPDYIDTMLRTKKEIVRNRIRGRRKRGTIFTTGMSNDNQSLIDIIKNTFSIFKKTKINIFKHRIIESLKGDRIQSHISYVDFPTSGPDVQYIVVTYYD